jgi:hypothetical protein
MEGRKERQEYDRDYGFKTASEVPAEACALMTRSSKRETPILKSAAAGKYRWPKHILIKQTHNSE